MIPFSTLVWIPITHIWISRLQVSYAGQNGEFDFYRVLSSSWKSVSSSSLWNGRRKPFLCILFLMTAHPKANPKKEPRTKQPTAMPATMPAISRDFSWISPLLNKLCKIQFHSVPSSMPFADRSSAVQITIPVKSFQSKILHTQIAYVAMIAS